MIKTLVLELSSNVFSIINLTDNYNIALNITNRFRMNSNFNIHLVLLRLLMVSYSTEKHGLRLFKDDVDNPTICIAYINNTNLYIIKLYLEKKK